MAITGAGRRPVCASAVEDALHGQRLSVQLITEAAVQPDEGLEMHSDLYAGPEYRRQMVRTYVRRALLGLLPTAG